MNIVNDEFIIELEKDYEYGRTHIRELWNLLIENFPFIENDELGAHVLEQIVSYRSSKKKLFFWNCNFKERRNTIISTR